MPPPLEIVVNGNVCRPVARTLAELVVEGGYGERTVATALNGDFVPAARRASVALNAGDTVEIVSPRQGG